MSGGAIFFIRRHRQNLAPQIKKIIPRLKKQKKYSADLCFDLLLRRILL
jgi:hypothetical protein